MRKSFSALLCILGFHEWKFVEAGYCYVNWYECECGKN